MNQQCYYRVSVKAIVVDASGRFLLARESNGKWELLGGGLDHGEDPLEGLRREVFEETGLEVLSVSDTPKYFTTSPRQDKGSFIANVVYEVTLKDLDFTPSDECQELRFFTVDEAKKEALFPNIHALLAVFNPALHTSVTV